MTRNRLRRTIEFVRRGYGVERLEPRCLLAGVVITEFMARNDDTLLDGDGRSSDWIEVFNSSPHAVDLAGMFLTDDDRDLTQWKFPSVTLQRGEYLVVFASSPRDENGLPIHDYVDADGNLHTNFKISGDGEYLALIERDGQTVASEYNPFPPQRTDVSYGKSFFSPNFTYFPEPTPGSANGEGVIGFLQEPKFSMKRGFFDEAFELIISSSQDATLVYTTDGSAPSLSNGVLIAPSEAGALAELTVATTSVVRAAAFRTGYFPGDVETHTYLFLEDVLRQPARIDGIPRGVDLEVDPDIVNDPRFSDEIDDALRAIPSLSITMSPDDLFGTENGIYTHPQGRGIEWERAASVELIRADGIEGFQEDAGVRIFGATTRNLPKKPFRISFRPQYGAKKLAYPLFPDAPVEKFDNIVLRAQQTNSWQRPGRTLDTEQADFLEDTWARDTARAMGKLDAHSTFVHLYLNGLYWGVYNPVERPDSSFGEEYLGGQEEDYDAINRRPVEFGGDGTVAIDGDLQAWKELMRMAEADLSIPENYEAIQAYINIDNVIQQFLIHQYMGHRDGPGNGHLYNNMRLIRRREAGEPFYAFVWDMEYSFVDVDDNLNINFPPTPDTMSVVYDALRANADFRMRYADLAHQYLFNDGALTPEKAAERYDQRAALIESAIIGETARWGDVLPNHLRPGEPFNRDDEWANERKRMLTEYFPQRTEILIGQLTDANLYPKIDAPRFLVDGEDQWGGDVLPRSELTFVQESRTGFTLHELIAVGDNAEIYIPSGNEFENDTSWTTVEFDIGDPSHPWGANGGLRGKTGVGFDTGNGRYNDLITTDVGRVVAEKESSSILIRQEFNIQQSFDHLQLDLQYDDGFVAYINGVRIASDNVNATSPPAKALATTTRESTDIETFQIDLADVPLNASRPNVLALHVLNRTVSNNDLLAVPRLYGATPSTGTLVDQVYFTLDGSDPRRPGGELAGQRFAGPLAISETVRVLARSFRDGQWSALSDATFIVDPNLGDFNADRQLNHQDIDAMFAAIRSSRHDPRFDLTQDGQVDEEDRDVLVQRIFQTTFGDSNLDGVFDSFDFVHVFKAGGFESGRAAGWSEGDWDGDGLFGTSDLVLAFQAGGYQFR